VIIDGLAFFLIGLLVVGGLVAALFEWMERHDGSPKTKATK